MNERTRNSEERPAVQKEVNCAMSEAIDISADNNVFYHLGIDPEVYSDVVVRFTTERILRQKLSGYSGKLSRRISTRLRDIRNKKNDYQEAMYWLAAGTQSVIELEFKTEEERQRVQEIGHAINNLFDRAKKYFPEGMERNESVPNDELKAWGNFWKPRINN